MYLGSKHSLLFGRGFDTEIPLPMRTDFQMSLQTNPAESLVFRHKLEIATHAKARTDLGQSVFDGFRLDAMGTENA